MSSTPEQRSQVGPYAGYYNRPPAAGDDLLTKVGPGTPCGTYLRRYWHPFLIASELKDLPLPVRLLGEDLVVFRDGSARLGLLHRHCAHRGTSLEFGIPAERGIRCCYHGWHFDVDGTILDTPSEPAGSRIKQNFCQGAYPVRESHGLLFAYLGPPEHTPELPVYDTFTHPAGSRLANFRLEYPCNWLQVVENAADPIHNAYLHAIVSGLQFSAAFRALPVLDFVETPLGFLSMATRKVNDFVFTRSSDIILPNLGQFAGGSNPVNAESFFVGAFTTRWVTPVDDHNCFYIGIRNINDSNVSSRQRKLDESMFGVGRLGIIGQTPDRPYEERQREPGDYDACVSQGLIVNRKAEHLGTTDRGVVMLRRMLMRAIQAIERGEPPTVPRLVRGGNAVRTYCHEFVYRADPDAGMDDRSRLEAFGRRAAQIVVDTDGLPPAEREVVARERIRDMLKREEPARRSAQTPAS
ncbi:MAG: Rieske 2Fe-2S domain-containing protein [Burkholderiales bacterium]